MPRHDAHEDDDVVEVELKRGGRKIRAAIKGLDEKAQQQILAALEVCITEAVDQALAWAAEQSEEEDSAVLGAADEILRAAGASADEPAVVGRVYGTLRLLGLEPDVQGAIKARRSAAGAKPAATLSEYLADVRRMFDEEEARASAPARRKR